MSNDSRPRGHLSGALRHGRSRLLWALAACALILATLAPLAFAQDGRPVRVVIAEEGALSARRSATVTVEPAMESNVAAATSGRVNEILRREGARVARSEPVIALEEDDAMRQVRNAELSLESARINLLSAQRQAGDNVAQLESQLRAARANLELAQSQLREGEALYAAGGIARSELLGLEANEAQARSNFEQARSALERAQRIDDEDLALLRVQYRQAEEALAQARDLLDETRVKAPFDGEIAAVLVSVGESVAAGTPAFRIVTPDEKIARLRVPPEDADALMESGVIWLPYRGLDYAAQLVRRSPAPGEQRLVELVAEIYAASTTIPAGTTLTYNYEARIAEGVLVPAGAVTAEVGRNVVFAIEEGVARRQEVTVLGEAGGSAALRGIDPGTEIIYPRPLDIRDGTEVEVVVD